MNPEHLPGWNSGRLNDLADRVAVLERSLADVPRLKDMAASIDRIEQTLDKNQGDEVERLKVELHEMKGRPRLYLLAFCAPVLAAVIGGVLGHLL